MLVIGGDEDDLRALRKPGQHTRELHAVQTWHLDVAENDVDRVGLQSPKGIRSAGRGADLADPVVLTQKERQLGQSGCLIVDQKRA